MIPQVKICGLTRHEDVECAIRHGADFLGFIVEAKSSRRLSADQAARIALPAKELASTVAVMVNPGDDLLRRVMMKMKPDYIQLHGDETPQRAAHIKSFYGVKIIKALPISEPQDLAAMFAYNSADLILLDAKAPVGAARGGHGKRFNWKILKDVPLPEIWALAGGLTPDTAARAARQTKAPILDVSSGVESAAGIKDASKIKALLNAVKHEQSR